MAAEELLRIKIGKALCGVGIGLYGLFGRETDSVLRGHEQTADPEDAQEQKHRAACDGQKQTQRVFWRLWLDVILSVAVIVGQIKRGGAGVENELCAAARAEACAVGYILPTVGAEHRDPSLIY